LASKSAIRCLPPNRSATVEDVVNVAAFAVVDAQENETYAHTGVPAEPELVGED